MKVYVITKIYGDYEQSFEIDSIWIDPAKAEEHKVKLMADNEIIKHTPPPYKEADYMLNNLSEKQDQDYYEWMMSKSKSEEFREPIIEEFELSGFSSTKKNEFVIPAVISGAKCNRIKKWDDCPEEANESKCRGCNAFF